MLNKLSFFNFTETTVIFVLFPNDYVEEKRGYNT